MPYKEFNIDGLGLVKVYKRKNNRSLRLSVSADGQTKVTIPIWAPYRAALGFVDSKKDWIIAQSSQRNLPLLTNGQRIGKSHHLVFRPGLSEDQVKTRISKTEIIVSYDQTLSPSSLKVQQAAQTACLRALRLQANSLLSQRLNDLASDRGIRYNQLTIKRMKTRWGSCDQHQRLVLNLYLVQLPWPLIDYVILHELAHIKVLHHGPKFWTELELLLPASVKLRKELKQYRPALLIA